MLADTCERTQLAQTCGLLFAVGLRGGYAETAWSEDEGATNYEAAVRVDDVPTAYSQPGICLAHGGEWFVAIEHADAVRVYRSQQHCANGSWAAYQTVD